MPRPSGVADGCPFGSPCRPDSERATGDTPSQRSLTSPLLPGPFSYGVGLQEEQGMLYDESQRAKAPLAHSERVAYRPLEAARMLGIGKTTS